MGSINPTGPRTGTRSSQLHTSPSPRLVAPSPHIHIHTESNTHTHTHTHTHICTLTLPQPYCFGPLSPLGSPPPLTHPPRPPQDTQDRVPSSLRPAPVAPSSSPHPSSPPGPVTPHTFPLKVCPPEDTPHPAEGWAASQAVPHGQGPWKSLGHSMPLVSSTVPGTQ